MSIIGGSTSEINELAKLISDIVGCSIAEFSHPDNVNCVKKEWEKKIRDGLRNLEIIQNIKYQSFNQKRIYQAFLNINKQKTLSRGKESVKNSKRFGVIPQRLISNLQSSSLSEEEEENRLKRANCIKHSKELFELGEFKSCRMLLESLKLHLPDPWLTFQIGQCYQKLALEKGNKRIYVESITKFDECIEQACEENLGDLTYRAKVRQGWSWYRMYQLNIKENELYRKKAIDCYEEALKVKSDDYECYELYARAVWGKDIKKAEDLAKQAHILEGADERVSTLYANICENQDKYKKAEKLYQDASNDPKGVKKHIPLLKLSKMYHKLSRRSDKRKFYHPRTTRKEFLDLAYLFARKAYRFEELHVETLTFLVKLCREMKKMKEARRYLKLAKEISPDNTYVKRLSKKRVTKRKK